MAFVAIEETSGEILGVARLHRFSNRDTAEYAVLVRSDLKGRGLGWLLMRTLIEYAQSEGIGALEGEVLAENATMLRMCAELGFVIAASPAMRTSAWLRSRLIATTAGALNVPTSRMLDGIRNTGDYRTSKNWPDWRTDLNSSLRRSNQESQMAGSTLKKDSNSGILDLTRALAVVAIIFGYQLYQERQKTDSIEINIGKGGISIERNSLCELNFRSETLPTAIQLFAESVSVS